MVDIKIALNMRFINNAQGKIQFEKTSLVNLFKTGNIVIITFTIK